MPELQVLYSREFLESLDKALSPEVENRFQSASEWADALHASPESQLSTLRMNAEDIDRVRQKKLGALKAPQPAPPISHQSQPSRKRSSFGSCLTVVVILALVTTAFFFWGDFSRHLPIGSTWDETVDWIDDAYHEWIGEVPPESSEFDINALSVPTLSIPTDTPSEPEAITSFSFPLADTVLAQSGMPSVRPDSLRVSSISILKATTPAAFDAAVDEPPLFLVIRRPDGTEVTRSDNSIRIGMIPGRGNITFSFPDLPKLSADTAYTYSFETAQGKQVPILVPLLTTGIPSDGQVTSYPLVRFICGLPLDAEEPDFDSPEATHVYNTLTQPSEGSSSSILALPATSPYLSTIRSMAEMGYPEAQYKMFRIFQNKSSDNASREAAEWLSRSAIGGYAPAQLELGFQFLNVNRFIVDPRPATTLTPQDYAQSARFLRMAIQHRETYAIYLMAILNSQGWGIPRSSTSAKLLFHWASQLDPSIKAQYVDPNADVVGFWGSQYLKSNTTTTFRFPLTQAQLWQISTLRLISTGGRSSCTVSDICIVRDDHVIAASSESYQLTPGAEPTPVRLFVPPDQSSADAFLEFKLHTSSSNICLIQIDRLPEYIPDSSSDATASSAQSSQGE